MSRFARIGVLGAGAWGTALAAALHQKRGSGGADSALPIWAREADVAAALKRGDGNPVYLPGIKLPAMDASSELAHLAGCDAILAVVPAQFARATFEALSPHVKTGTPVLLFAKGIEQKTLSLMTEVLADSLPQAIPAVLSGPSFAADVSRGLPTAVTLACEDETLGRDLMEAIG